MLQAARTALESRPAKALLQRRKLLSVFETPNVFIASTAF